MYVLLLDARWLCGKGAAKWSVLDGNLVVQLQNGDAEQISNVI